MTEIEGRVPGGAQHGQDHALAEEVVVLERGDADTRRLGRRGVIGEHVVEKALADAAREVDLRQRDVAAFEGEAHALERRDDEAIGEIDVARRGERARDARGAGSIRVEQCGLEGHEDVVAVHARTPWPD